MEFKDIPAIDRMISNRYQQKLNDVQEWLSLTEWSQQQLQDHEIARVQAKLLQLELIEQEAPFDTLVHQY